MSGHPAALCHRAEPGWRPNSLRRRRHVTRDRWARRRRFSPSARRRDLRTDRERASGDHPLAVLNFLRTDFAEAAEYSCRGFAGRRREVRDHEVICATVPVVLVPRKERARRGGKSAGTTLPFSHNRKPPRKALALSPGREPGGSASSFFALPPPITL